MTTHDRFGGLRALLQKTPSERLWWEIVDELALWDDEARERIALPYVSDHLERWPTEIARATHWPNEASWRRRLANAWTVRSAEEVRALMESGRAARLVALSVYDFSQGAVEALVPLVEQLSRIARVEVSANNGRALAALLAARWPTSLRALRVSFDLDAPQVWARRGVAALAQNEALAGLETLELWGFKIGDAGASALASSPHLRALRTLQLYQCGIGPAGARALADSPLLDTVERLDLSSNELGMGLVALIGSPHTRALRALEFDCYISATCARALVRAPWPPLLGSLMIHDQMWSEQALEALAALPALRLVAGYNQQAQRGEATLARLLSSPHLAGLRSLSLRRGEGDAALVVRALRGGVARLGVEELSVSPAYLEALDPAWPALRRVSCGDIHTPDDVAALAGLIARGALREIEALSLDGDASALDLSAIWSAAQLPRLRFLELSYLGLGDAGLRALLKSGLCDQLTTIHLDNNHLTDEAAILIAQHPHLALFCGQHEPREGIMPPLNYNQIGDRGLRAIIRSPHIPSVTHLDLEDNPITPQGLIALAADPALARFQGQLHTNADEEAWRALHASPYANPPLREQAARWLAWYEKRRADIAAHEARRMTTAQKDKT